MSSDAQAVLDFWFEALTPAQWFKKDPEMDRTISQRFGALHAQAARCECYAWRETAQGRLAEIIVLDQFSRNIYRDDARAFATDALALVLAQEGVSANADAELTSQQRVFLYMPYMHSESAAIHEVAMELFKQPGLENNYDFEVRHKAIIDRFGRYPHRNALLGRASTDEELAFLKEPGSSF
ncbi:DUF924 family protein [Vreelandella boliviensis]|uniref:DUF924 domain-containing protein n=1 Tax=Vreelandella boliviensis LC1 TaxID=1072583 RepID=A0A265DX72_9GAMM|nr:DUF924 family protein [Halomonas boliviensis]EHJ91442.1 hypothetical protein KUC_3885 [Halomonas boliviensis LC1]OZT73929.1 DUF924 domain-containing protein [Halomonas boliviensis LC1]